jgi:hypothetical protein
MNNLLKTTLIIGILITMVFIAGCSAVSDTVMDTKVNPATSVTETLGRLNASEPWITTDTGHTVYYYYVVSSTGSLISKSVPTAQSEVFVNAPNGTIITTTPEFTQYCKYVHEPPFNESSCEWFGGAQSHYMFYTPNEVKL